ncbi:hypothetical protein FRC08_008203 [Ceratobasidium sp. 394]|nr:hypothetical protein FRC08_008203 [Ceratobasidium sp. 394]KAG9092307.1 hypothetical protein FS749_015847 [Ceratobasidium sp. UAMH 11750]
MVKCSAIALVSLGTVVSALAPPYSRYLTLEQVKQKFCSEGIVPDVLPSFNPKSFLYLTYTGNLSDGSSAKVVLPGTSFARNDTLIPPELSATGLKSGPYVIAIVDPDAPSRANPTSAQIRHMLAANLTVSSARSKYISDSFLLKNSTAAVNDYRPPTPPAGSGPHRYVALLYAQPPVFDISFLNLSDIRLFNISSFAARTGLGQPLAGTFLTVEVKNATSTA